MFRPCAYPRIWNYTISRNALAELPYSVCFMWRHARRNQDLIQAINTCYQYEYTQPNGIFQAHYSSAVRFQITGFTACPGRL